MLGDKRGSKNVRKIRLVGFSCFLCTQKSFNTWNSWMLCSSFWNSLSVLSNFFPQNKNHHWKVKFYYFSFLLMEGIWSTFNSKIFNQPNTIPAKQLQARRKLMLFVSSSLIYLFTQFKVLFFHSTVLSFQLSKFTFGALQNL